MSYLKKKYYCALSFVDLEKAQTKKYSKMKSFFVILNVLLVIAYIRAATTTEDPKTDATEHKIYKRLIPADVLRGKCAKFKLKFKRHFIIFVKMERKKLI